MNLLTYLKSGGVLMIPIIIVAFLIWHCYFTCLTALKHGCSVQEIRHDLPFMAALVATAPLLGLLGTVIGMMEAFHATALLSTTSPDASYLASGIGKALITTQAGLAAAIPGSLALAHLRHRLKNHHA